MRVLLRFVLLGAIALYPARGHADPVSDEIRAQASEYVKQGIAAQGARDFDRAIELYSRAYQLIPHPALIFDMAQAHRLAGRLEEARALYEKYIDEDPRGSKVATARELVAEIKAHQAEQARTAAPTSQKEDVPKPGNGEAVPRRAEEIETDPPAARGRGVRAAGLVTGAAGLAALAIGTGFGVQASTLSNQLSRVYAPYTRAKEDKGRRAEQIAIVGWVSGALLVVAGASLYWQGRRQGNAESVSVAPVLGDQLVGLALTGPM